jgi:uncharacterized membrane protein YphA (DoxX/SURF4 family)
MTSLVKLIRESLIASTRSATWLPFFRINVALFSLFHFLAIQPDFADIFSFRGYVYPDILDATYDHVAPTVVSVHVFLNQYVTSSYEQLLTIVRVAYPVFLVLLALGLFTRLSAIASLLLHLVLIGSIHLYQYGVDFYTSIALFYCCVFPSGRIFSMDAKIFRWSDAVNHVQYRNLLRWHLCIAYLFSGFGKIIGESWRNGEAIWKVMHSHVYYSFVDVDFLAHTPFFLIAGWCTVLLELLYGIGMNVRWTRKYWLAAIIGMHVFIACFMGLFFFSALLIILNLAAYYEFQEKTALPDLLTEPSKATVG